MSEIKDGKDIKVIAFYLPQFHAIPENDKAYGKGFVEWTNTRKAKPLYEGHYQPRIPLKRNYYNLLDNSVMEWQSILAQKYSIWGFCYYHYWFKNGKKLLEKPIEAMLDNKNVTSPFCLCWANENWSKRWDGGNNEIIVEQDYGDIEDWELHLQYLINFFKDPRYITIDGNPLLVIYKPQIIPKIDKMLRYWKKRIKQFGFNGIAFAVQYPEYYVQGYKRKRFDYFIEFEPQFIRDWIASENNHNLKHKIKKYFNTIGLERIVNIIKKSNHYGKAPVKNELTLRNYDDDWQRIIEYKSKESNFLYGAFVDWDNTPRNKNGLSYYGVTPNKFYSYFNQQIKKIIESNSPNVIFINAWNEWAEGAYLEPDEKYEYSFLKAVQQAVKNYKLEG